MVEALLLAGVLMLVGLFAMGRRNTPRDDLATARAYLDKGLFGPAERLLAAALARETDEDRITRLQVHLALCLVRSRRAREALETLEPVDASRITPSDLKELARFPALTPFLEQRRPPARRVPNFAGRYQREDKLGGGTMGEVYRAWDCAESRPVALKLLTGSASGFIDLPRFAREIQALSQLTHPRLVRMLDGDAGCDTPYLAMELLEGGTLAQVRLGSPGKSVPFLIQLLEGLTYIHAKGYLHRDLKPSNVFVKTSGEPVLIDFGIARKIDGTRHTELGVVMGTLAYMAPELLNGRDATPASDVFATGLLGIETAFEFDVHGGGAAHREPGNLISSLMSGVYFDMAAKRLRAEGRLGQVLLRAIHPEPARRFGSAEALSAELKTSMPGAGLHQ
jgi:serine/threonine protein kinase